MIYLLLLDFTTVRTVDRLLRFCRCFILLNKKMIKYKLSAKVESIRDWNHLKQIQQIFSAIKESTIPYDC